MAINFEFVCAENNNSEVLQSLWEITIPPCFKYYGLETSRIRIPAVKSFTNPLVD